MSTPQAHLSPQSTPGLLGGRGEPLERASVSPLIKPWAWLWRVRPVKVATLARQLRRYDRTAQALRLLTQHFPADLAAYDTLSAPVWWEILAHLLNRVEASGWFEADWNLLNDGWAYWVEDVNEEGDHLAAFLHTIPVHLFGFTASSVTEHLVVELLYVLLSDNVEAISSKLAIALEVYDDFDNAWGEAKQQAAWARLHGIEADPGLYPEPVRWLPELARWVCHTTGNPILDLAPSYLNRTPQPAFTWTDDLETVRTAWRRARPLIEQLNKLKKWLDQDEQRLVLLFSFFLEGQYDQLDW